MEINQKIKVAVADFDKDFADGLCLYLRQSCKDRCCRMCT